MATVNRWCTAEGKQQVKLVISRECNLSFFTQRMRFAHLAPAHTEVHAKVSHKNFNGSFVFGAFDMKLLYTICQKKLLYEKKGSTTSSMIQTKLLYTEQSCLLNNLYYQSLQHILVEGGILSQISRKSGFKTLVSGKYSMTQLASFFLKTILKYPLFMKVKNTKQTLISKEITWPAVNAQWTMSACSYFTGRQNAFFKVSINIWICYSENIM